eukprot:SAG11_NODE_283_length_11241_cov_8.234428_7_plen_224_part_00
MDVLLVKFCKSLTARCRVPGKATTATQRAHGGAAADRARACAGLSDRARLALHAGCRAAASVHAEDRNSAEAGVGCGRRPVHTWLTARRALEVKDVEACACGCRWTAIHEGDVYPCFGSPRFNLRRQDEIVQYGRASFLLFIHTDSATPAAAAPPPDPAARMAVGCSTGGGLRWGGRQRGRPRGRASPRWGGLGSCTRWHGRGMLHRRATAHHQVKTYTCNCP